MEMRAVKLVVYVISLFLFVPASAFGQEATIAGNQDLLDLRKTPEELLTLSYETPAGPSTLMMRTSEDGEMADYSGFYFSDAEALSNYVNTAIYANPALWESEHRWRAAVQRIPQVTALPDPMFSITAFIQEVETRVGPQEAILSISQKFPWFGKLDAKGEMALRDALVGAEQYQAQIREAVVAVKRAYYELAYLDEAIKITEEDKGLLEHFEEVAETRYSTGKGIQQAVIKIQAEITKDDDRLYMLKQQRESVAANLNTLMDRPPHEPIPTIMEQSIPAVDINIDQLYSRGRTNRHELKAAEYMIEKGDQAIRLAKKEYFPDFNVGLNYIFVGDREDSMGKLIPPEDNGDDAYSIMFGFNIPLWEGKLMSGVKEAREIKLASERNYDKIENAIEFSIRDGVLRVETAFDQLNLYAKVLIPQAEQALESTVSAYSTGQLKSLDLIDSERFLLGVRLARAKLRADYLKALADIEIAIGTAFPAGQSPGE